MACEFNRIKDEDRDLVVQESRILGVGSAIEKVAAYRYEETLRPSSGSHYTKARHLNLCHEHQSSVKRDLRATSEAF